MYLPDSTRGRLAARELALREGTKTVGVGNAGEGRLRDERREGAIFEGSRGFAAALSTEGVSEGSAGEEAFEAILTFEGLEGAATVTSQPPEVDTNGAMAPPEPATEEAEEAERMALKSFQSLERSMCYQGHQQGEELE